MTCSAQPAESPVLLDDVQRALLHGHLQQPRAQERHIPAAHSNLWKGHITDTLPAQDLALWHCLISIAIGVRGVAAAYKSPWSGVFLG